AGLAGVTPPWAAVCAVLRTDDPEVIQKNYAVEVVDGRITALVEKPGSPHGGLVGCGTFLLDPQIFATARATPPSTRTGRPELLDGLARVAHVGGVVRPSELTGHYLNVNSVDDLTAANFLARSLEFEHRRVSVVIPASQEAASIGAVIRDFREHAD